MHAITWIPGSNPELDFLFNELRERRFRDQSHRLWKNYSKESFNNVAALSITFDDKNNPEVCSSISQSTCWPDDVYRIYNRVWRLTNKKTFLQKLSPTMAAIAQSQIQWLKENTDCKLYFVSRQTANWDEWLIDRFKTGYNMDFKTDNYLYLTCPNECDETCWQRIIYNGDESLLEIWKRRLRK